MCYFCRRHLIFVALLLSISWLLCTCFMTVIFSSLLLVALVISLDGLTSPFYVLLLTSCDKSFTPVMFSIHVLYTCSLYMFSIYVLYTCSLKVWFLGDSDISLTFWSKMICFSESVFMMCDLIWFSSHRYSISSFKHFTQSSFCDGFLYQLQFFLRMLICSSTNDFKAESPALSSWYFFITQSLLEIRL